MVTDVAVGEGVEITGGSTPMYIIIELVYVEIFMFVRYTYLSQ